MWTTPTKHEAGYHLLQEVQISAFGLRTAPDIVPVSCGTFRRYHCRMNDTERKPDRRRSDGDPAVDEQAITAEARRGRTFDVQALIGREAASALKGASPVPAAQQALLALGALLESRLPDPDGSLTRTLLARLADESPLLDRHRDHPGDALAELLDRILSTPSELAELVRQTDARWGRDYDERPRFDRAGKPPVPDDPYTEAGVRALLENLRAGL